MRAARLAGARRRSPERSPRGRRDDRGASLVELVVVMGLLGLLGTLVMSVSVQTARALARSTERAADTQQVRVALEGVTRSLRSAIDPDGTAPAGSVCAPAGTGGRRCAFVDSTSAHPALRSGPTQVAFYSSVYDLSGATATGAPAAPRLHRYALTAAGELVEEVWSTDAAASATLPAPDRRRVLARGLDVTATAPPLFTYLAASDTAIPASGPTPSSLTSATEPLLAPGDVGRVAAVEVWVTAVRERGGRPVAAVDSVVLTNDPEVTSK